MSMLCQNITSVPLITKKLLHITRYCTDMMDDLLPCSNVLTDIQRSNALTDVQCSNALTDIFHDNDAFIAKMLL